MSALDLVRARKLKVLAVCDVTSYEGHGTGAHRISALRALGFNVNVVDSALLPTTPAVDRFRGRVRNRLFQLGIHVRPADPAHVNSRVVNEARAAQWDILWLDKELNISRETMRTFRRLCPSALIFGFSPDDMFARHNQSRNFLESLPEYDAFITTKSFNVSELRSLGCGRVVFVGNGFDPDTFRPMALSGSDYVTLGGDVGFIGAYERERAAYMLELAQLGLKVRVWGGGWEKMKDRHPNLRLEFTHIFGDAFARACGAFKINLAFLRKLNRDQQTTRSVEIPACGGFMLAERTEEHLDMFIEGREAEFFETAAELHEKCRYYLERPEERLKVAEAGRQRCLSSGYDNVSRLGEVLGKLLPR